MSTPAPIDAPRGMAPYLTGELAADRFAAACALHWYCVNYHEGQWSDLYAIQCRLGYTPGQRERGPEVDATSEAIYAELVGDEIDAQELADWIEATREARGGDECAHWRCES